MAISACADSWAAGCAGQPWKSAVIVGPRGIGNVHRRGDSWYACGGGVQLVELAFARMRWRVDVGRAIADDSRNTVRQAGLFDPSFTELYGADGFCGGAAAYATAAFLFDRKNVENCSLGCSFKSLHSAFSEKT